jgi:hypothetical protein
MESVISFIASSALEDYFHNAFGLYGPFSTAESCNWSHTVTGLECATMPQPLNNNFSAEIAALGAQDSVLPALEGFTSNYCFELSLDAAEASHTPIYIRTLPPG